MGWFEKFVEISSTILDSASAVAQANQVNQWILMDLDMAMEEIRYMVDNYPHEVITSYEELFLNASRFIIDADQRMQLMKLYAWLKLLETGKRNNFIGFAMV